MKTLLESSSVAVPPGVTVTVKSRCVTVKGKHGSLQRSFRHIPVEMIVSRPSAEAGCFVKVSMYSSASKTAACLRTLCSHIKNMINGVSRQYEYKMRFVYAHFPINLTISPDNRTVEIRNYLGEKRVRVVRMLPGVTCQKTPQVKDQISLTGMDIELVSRSAALIHQSTLAKKKDIRKFLDGIYVSETGFLEKDE